MKKSEEKIDVYEFVDKVIPDLFLQGWEITIIELSEDKESGACAELTSKNQYKNATLIVYPKFFRESVDKQKRIIIHELCHIITSLQNGLLQASRGGMFVNEHEQSYVFEEETSWMATIISRLLLSK